MRSQSCTFGVHINDPAFGPALVQRSLSSHTERVAQLRFPRAEFTEDFRNRTGLNAPAEQHIQIIRAYFR
jgi:hypothetical protein